MRELSFQFGDMRKFWKGIVETVVQVVEVLTAAEMHTYERLQQSVHVMSTSPQLNNNNNQAPGTVR